MDRFRSIVLNKERILVFTNFVAILGLSILAPLFKIQMVTGPMVNALLFIATVILGPASAIIIGLLPSVFSLSTGLLSFTMAPLIPFIMISNAILVLTFSCFQKKNFWLGIISASIIKFVFLAVVSQVLVNFLLKTALARQAAIMFSWPQLYTAFLGGIVAFIFLKFIKKI